MHNEHYTQVALHIEYCTMATEHCTLYAAVSADRTVSPVSVLRPAKQIVSQTRRFLSQNEKRRRNKSVFIFEILLLCFQIKSHR